MQRTQPQSCSAQLVHLKWPAWLKPCARLSPPDRQRLWLIARTTITLHSHSCLSISSAAVQFSRRVILSFDAPNAEWITPRCKEWGGGRLCQPPFISALIVLAVAAWEGRAQSHFKSKLPCSFLPPHVHARCGIFLELNVQFVFPFNAPDCSQFS